MRSERITYVPPSGAYSYIRPNNVNNSNNQDSSGSSSASFTSEGEEHLGVPGLPRPLEKRATHPHLTLAEQKKRSKITSKQHQNRRAHSVGELQFALPTSIEDELYEENGYGHVRGKILNADQSVPSRGS